MIKTHTHLIPGVPLALGSAVLFGASAPAAKLLIGAIDPWLLAGILYLGAGVGLGLVHWGRPLIGLDTVETPLKRADLPWLLAVILFGGILGPLLLMFGLSLTSATSASLLLNLEGLATMAIAWIVFRENVDRRLLLGAAAILSGAVLLSWNGQGLSLDTGGLFVAAACLSWGIDNNLTRKLSAADPVQIAMIKGLAAGATNIALALSFGATFPGAGLMTAGAVVGFFGIGVSLVMFMLGLRHLGAARTGAYFSLAPFIGALLALAIFRETVTLPLLLSGLLMAFGLWLHLSERHEHAHLHDDLEHDHAHVHDDHHNHDHGKSDPGGEPHSHRHRHQKLVHSHPHYPDLHHGHNHE
ncbi:MAG: DMT family transporter [Allorhizobium sp.]